MKYLPALLLVLTAATVSAAKEKEKDTNNLPRVNTLIPQLLPRNPSAKPPPAPVQKQLDAFFQGVQAGKIDESFRALVANNPSPNSRHRTTIDRCHCKLIDHIIRNE